jgi:hypothetical protein
MGHRGVLRLEAGRAARTVVYAIITIVLAAFCVCDRLYTTSEWPQRWRLPNVISAHTLAIVFIVTLILALLLLLATVVNGRRWRLARVVRRLSDDPDIIKSMPGGSAAEILPRTHLIPPISVEQRKPRDFPRPRQLRRVTSAGNVIGARPLSIAYLRLFENDARNRTFMQGAWREFGYVHLLRSAASVTPGEYWRAKRTGGVTGLFLTSMSQLTIGLNAAPQPPERRRWHTFIDIAPWAIRVWDRYGSYPASRYLCHGTIWKAAIDELLRRVDLVVLDLSGFGPKNCGTEYELQRVIDRFPVERIVFLADPRSDKKFLCDQIRASWLRMAAGSPNSGTTPKSAYLTVTDRYRITQPPQVTVPGPSPGTVTTRPQGPPQVRLVASRGQTRRLAAAVQERAVGAAPPSRGAAPPSRSRVRLSTVAKPEPVIRRRDESADYVTSSAKAGPGFRVPKLTALAGAVLFLLSVTLLTSYVDNGTGPRSLFQATHGDLASPLYPHDFLIVIGLLAVMVVFTAVSLLTAGRWAMVGATAAAVGLIGYTLYIPSIGRAPGLGPYGSSYWISLAAAVVMALAAGVGAIRMPRA